jgi:hypothetical protein
MLLHFFDSQTRTNCEGRQSIEKLVLGESEITNVVKIKTTRKCSYQPLPIQMNRTLEMFFLCIDHADSVCTGISPLFQIKIVATAAVWATTKTKNISYITIMT